MILDDQEGVDAEPLIQHRQHHHNHIQVIIEALEIRPANLQDLQELLHQVVEDEHGVDALAGHDKVVKHRNVADQLHGAKCGPGNNAPRGGKFKQERDNAEEVEVGVVDGKVEEHGARAPLDPEVLHQFQHHQLRLVAHRVERLDNPVAAVLSVLYTGEVTIYIQYIFSKYLRTGMCLFSKFDENF